MSSQCEKSTGTNAIDSENEYKWESHSPKTTDEGVVGVLHPDISHTIADADLDTLLPPDGGWKAWLCTLCGHLLFMNTWGFINSFGIFQAYYTSFLGRQPSDISWIGSVQVFLSFFVGAFIGRYIDAGHLRLVLSCGTTLVIIGIFTASFSTQYWQLLLSQGLCCGLGNGFLVTPAVSVTSTYFARRRSLAIGIATSGSVTGGLVFSAMARQLLPSVGFGWAMRAIGFVQAGTLLFVISVCSLYVLVLPRPLLQSPDSEVQNFWAVFFGYYYIAPYSRDIVVPYLSYTDSLNLLLILSGVGVVGRMIPNHYADSWGPLNLMIPTCLVAAIAMFSWISVHTPGQVYAWTVVYGIIGGSILSLFPAGISSLTTDLSTRGARIGMNFTVVSFATLTGNPIGGALITAMDGSYLGAQVFMGTSFIIGAAFIMAARVARQRKTQDGWLIKI
ncbi:hypothetical protein F66182_8161 [Fusarium sp. NRRL 66182]|nr:hypothetical protein F66182_8161 [Fusarium sp. NRRL 66182]